MFGDLEGQFASAENAGFEAEVAELAIAERASVDLAARLRAAVGTPDTVTLHLAGAGVVRGVVTDATPSWVLLQDGAREHLVPVAAIAAASPIPQRSLPWGEVEGRLTLGHALRALAESGAAVIVETTGGEFRGRVASVGADHVDVKPGAQVAAVVVPFGALRRVTSA